MIIIIIIIILGCHFAAKIIEHAPKILCKEKFDGYDRQLTRAALGRPFRLGMLYDCRTDTLLTGLPFWSMEELDSITYSERMENSSVHLIMEDSLDCKAKHMGISGEDKLGVMSGMIKLSGSGEYLSDTKTTEMVARVSLHYQSTSEFRQLDTTSLLKTLPDECGKSSTITKLNLATHVVVGILYGADAVFVFEHPLRGNSSDEVMACQAYMELLISQISSKGEVDINKAPNLLSVKDNMSCKFYGDIILENLPTKFSEAKEAYNIVFKTINIGGEGEKKVVPKKVWLLPLSAFINVPTIKQSISNETVSIISNVINDLQLLRVVATDLKKIYNFPPFSDYIHNQLDIMQALVSTRLSCIITEMRQLLPKIRGDPAYEEKLLEDLVKVKHDPRPFDLAFLKQWLKAKENEAQSLNSLYSLVASEDGVKVVGKPGQFNNLFINDEWEYLLVAEFRVPDSRIDPISHAATAGIIDSNEKMSHFDADMNKRPHWYKDRDLILKLKELLSKFMECANINKKSQSKRVIFAVTLTESNTTDECMPFEPEQPACIKLCQRSGTVQEVCLPSEPKDVMLHDQLEEGKFKICWTKSENAVQSPYTITVARSDGTGESWKWTTTPGCSSLLIPRSKLHENHEYTAAVQANFMAPKEMQSEFEGYALDLDKPEDFVDKDPEQKQSADEELLTANLITEKENPNLIGQSKEVKVKFMYTLSKD